jgi:dinuclear metal center YbgI/SA1388 family protein
MSAAQKKPSSKAPNKTRASKNATGKPGREPEGSNRNAQRWTVAQISAACAEIAPPSLAADWDNVGLLAGSADRIVQRVLLCIDLMPAVVDEAIATKAGFVMAYHPPILKPVKSLCVPGTGMETQLFRCIEEKVAVYSMHTALDAADGGTNDVLSELAGLVDIRPLEFVDSPSAASCKLVVFVPEAQVDQVADAIFAAGAGRIGDYSRCSYRLSGTGTFFGEEGTNPAVGERGRDERVEEVRLETVVRAAALPDVIDALREAHPYEEPAFDIYPTKSAPVSGIGRIGILPDEPTLAELADLLTQRTQANGATTVGEPTATLKRAIVVVGAGGGLPFSAGLGPGDVVLTGEMRHHTALSILRAGASAICLGHWTSERPTLASVGTSLAIFCPGLEVRLSEADAEPFVRA